MPHNNQQQMSPVQSTQLSPMARSILGLEQAGFISPNTRESRPGCSTDRRNRNTSDRRVTSYYNHFSSRCAVSSDGPPTYATVTRDARFKPSRRYLDNGDEILPKYTCTVAKEGPMQMRVEACSPFMNLAFQEWRPVYVTLQGTQMTIFKLKTAVTGKLQVHSAGRVLRKYTLQHAEVGIAPDITHSVMTPTSRLASMIPPIARRKACEKDPDLFRVERHYALRMRAEMDQIVLTHTMDEQIMSWVNHISAGIDIAPAIDERSPPRQCTMPRRRRCQPRSVTAADLTDERFIEQQRRMLAQFRGQAEDSTSEPNSNTGSSFPSPSQSFPAPPPDQEEDIDLSAIAEDSIAGGSRSPTAEHTSRSVSIVRLQSGCNPLLDPTPLNHDANGKWAPLHPRTASQQWRYIRRCMPILLAETPRHSSVMINEGHYVRPNYKMDILEDWVLSPPSYEAHEFPEDITTTLGLRLHRISSTSGTSTHANSRRTSSSEMRRIDSRSAIDVIEIAALGPSGLNVDFKTFGLSEQEITAMQTAAARREADKELIVTTVREIAPPRTAIGV